MMEKTIFPKPAVAGLLKDNFIEIRLHTDARGPKLKQILELRDKYSGSVAIPTYVVVDPQTLKRMSRVRGLKEEAKFLQFLKSGLNN